MDEKTESQEKSIIEQAQLILTANGLSVQPLFVRTEVKGEQVLHFFRGKSNGVTIRFISEMKDDVLIGLREIGRNEKKKLGAELGKVRRRQRVIHKQRRRKERKKTKKAAAKEAQIVAG